MNEEFFSSGTVINTIPKYRFEVTSQVSDKLHSEKEILGTVIACLENHIVVEYTKFSICKTAKTSSLNENYPIARLPKLILPLLFLLFLK